MLKFEKSIARRMQHNRKRLGFGGGAGSGGSTTTQNSSPWAGQQPYLSNVFSAAQNQYQNYTPQYYGAAGTTLNGQDISGQSTVAPMNATENSAISDIGNTGLNGTSSMNAANGAMTNELNANPTSNPYMSQMVQNTLASTVPGLESQFAQGNAMNSPAAAYAVSQGANSAVGGLMFNQYNQNLANQNNAAGQAPGLQSGTLAGQNAALTAGQAAQTQAQNQLQNQVSMFNYQQQLPYQQLNQYANTVNGQYGQAATQTNTAPAQNLFSVLFSDRRLKKDIKRIGTNAKGLARYSFKYIWDATNEHVGYMADEVENFMPEAIGNLFGFKTVDYDLVGA
jgi:hypothetical protein